MKCFSGLTGKRITDRPVVFSLGAFDGVHIGHQHLLSLGRRLAHDHGCLFTVLTFSTLPRQLLFPHEPPSYLTSPLHKRRLLESAGVDLLIELPFSKELMAMEALPFLKEIEAMVSIDTWVGGKDLHFGKDQEGDCAFIEQRAEQTGMEAFFFDRIGAADEHVSSSRIRSLVKAGVLLKIQTLLGRPYSLVAPCVPIQAQESGLTVKNGSLLEYESVFDRSNPGAVATHKSRLTSLNGSAFPAFSLDASLLCLPPDGVYPATVELGETKASYEALLHIHHDDRGSSPCEVVVRAAAVPPVELLEVTPYCDTVLKIN